MGGWESICGNKKLKPVGMLSYTILSDVDSMIYYTMRCRFTINVFVSEQKAEPGGVLACSPV